MRDKELDEIINTYDWIKTKKYVDEDFENPDIDWKSAYKSLLKHHKEETEFLIDKTRKLAETLQNYRYWDQKYGDN